MKHPTPTEARAVQRNHKRMEPSVEPATERDSGKGATEQEVPSAGDVTAYAVRTALENAIRRREVAWGAVVRAVHDGKNADALTRIYAKRCTTVSELLDEFEEAVEARARVRLAERMAKD